jgi:hypothetical protein
MWLPLFSAMIKLMEPIPNAVVLLKRQNKFYVLVSLVPLQHQAFLEGRTAIYSVNYIS